MDMDKIEVTPEMLEAGWVYLGDEWPEWPNIELTIKRMLAGLYQAMSAAGDASRRESLNCESSGEGESSLIHDSKPRQPRVREMIEPDPDYDFTPPLKKPTDWWPTSQKKGRQCGECGMKFEYGKSYGYCCRNPRCPTGWNY